MLLKWNHRSDVTRSTRTVVVSKCIIAAACLATALATHAEPAPAQTATKPEATYSNPLLANHSIADPDVIRVKGTYYLYPTSIIRGYEVFVSKDLVHWEGKGEVFNDPRGGDWAPDVFHDERGDGKFYLYYTDNSPKETIGGVNKQIGVAVANSPLGPFVDKGALANESIDAEMFQDDDGKYYLYYVQLTGGFKILVQPMANPFTKSGDTKELIHPTEPWEKASGEVTEGPFMLKRNGTYYLMYSGSGADSAKYAIGYATSKSPTGPFVKYAGNPIVRSHDNVIGPGHHCVVEGPAGDLWLVYHQKYKPSISWSRFLAIDPLWFDGAGVIHAKSTHGTIELAPTAQTKR